MNILEIDGSQGEGGGQILRTALSLALLQGRALRMRHIRAGRSKPGLMRQHVTCVRAAAAIGGADVQGADVGSTELTFVPAGLHGGEFEFKIGTAGSVMLVLQTVLPALLRADRPSMLRIEGGTHVAAAPCTDFVAKAFLPVLWRMGGRCTLRVERHGFFPAGGGLVHAEITPSALTRLTLHERGQYLGVHARVLTRSLPHHVGERELGVLQAGLRLDSARVEQLPADLGPANAVLVHAQHEHIDEVVTSLGEKGLAAETVANQACSEVRRYLAHGAPVGEHLADQLLLPMVLAGGGSFVTGRPSSHLETNARVIEQFGAARVSIAPDERDPQRRFHVSLAV